MDLSYPTLFFGKPQLHHKRALVALIENFGVVVNDAAWDPFMLVRVFRVDAEHAQRLLGAAHGLAVVDLVLLVLVVVVVSDASCHGVTPSLERTAPTSAGPLRR